MDEFFSDPVFLEKFGRLDEVSTSEFHTYRVDDLVLPGVARASVCLRWGGGQAVGPAWE